MYDKCHFIGTDNINENELCVYIIHIYTYIQISDALIDNKII